MRILLKLSGESLGGASERGLAPEVLHRFAVAIYFEVYRDSRKGFSV